MADAGLMFACIGCCCGHPDRGGAMAPQRALRSGARRAYQRSGLAGRVRLAFTDCLGPCSEANVVFLYLRGRPLWFRRINSPELFEALLDYTRRVIAEPDAPLPERLEAQSFAWTGGGIGPEPPVLEADVVVADAEVRQ